MILYSKCLLHHSSYLTQVRSDSCTKSQDDCKCYLAITCLPLHEKLANPRQVSVMEIKKEAKKNMKVCITKNLYFRIILRGFLC